MAELSKTYAPQDIERDIYAKWEASGYFNPDNLPNSKKRKPFVISMPPPNITGELHFGHALGMTLEDILIRYHRMLGDAALWLPGTDHAAISTQVVVERKLRDEGIDRRTIGREKFLEHVWKWKEQYGTRIVDQIKRMGASADWSRQRFTMDQQLTNAVNTAFITLYNDGLIYRGERIINWCSDCQTAVSDLEVDKQETPGSLWHIRYPLADGSSSITVATTRPETMLGDTAVAVNPKDPRYTSLIGQTIKLPIVSREIPIVGDERIDQEFGTGAVKVTPGHDPLDFDIGQTHKLPIITVIGFNGHMTNEAGPGFVGLSVSAARKKVLVELRQLGVLEKEEDYIHAVGYCQRSKTIIEPLVSLQWFLKTKPLAEKAMQVVRKGEITIVPKRFEKTYFYWLENIRDWNISRQIWWGHRLPVWYKDNDIKVSATSPGDGWTQDEDTLDTWFSSGLWTFSTLGWPASTSLRGEPNKTDDLKRFHPTDVMETGWDILFFWVARMIMFSLYFQKEVPFKTVYLHGLVLDKDGKKMSKSKGTGLDPLVLGDTYGMDATRMSFVVGTAPGQDFQLQEQKVASFRNFANKLWNITRFILAQPKPAQAMKPDTLADKWILTRLQGLIVMTTKAIDRYDFSGAGQQLYDFIWHDFADWYIEASKVQANLSVQYYVLEHVLALLHPFMPFITEAVWSHLNTKQLLMVSDWPTFDKTNVFQTEANAFTKVQSTVAAVRNFKKFSALPTGAIGEYTDVAGSQTELLQALSKVTVRHVDRLGIDGHYKTILLGEHRFQFAAEYVEKYESWRSKERRSLEKYIVGIEKKLSNKQFVDHAPAEVVKAEQQKLAEAKERLLAL